MGRRKNRPIGRNLKHASLKKRTGYTGQFTLVIDGDRGALRLHLTEGEVRGHFDPETDTVEFAFKLEPGTIQRLLNESGIRERRTIDEVPRTFGPAHPTGGRIQ